jgi:predicted TIM-barrel fold metal-dependent hydrolase
MGARHRHGNERPEGTGEFLFNDCHVHLTNYVQQGTDARNFLELMGNRVGSSVLFGIPLQQTWSHRISGDRPPTYYLSSDAPLYYYSFTDAFIAQQYLGLAPEQRERLYPMITGFNPADMYGVEHIRRVLETYPGVFVGIGEFTIHKEFVSGKIAGDVPSLLDPALDRILDFAEETGLLVLLHNDMATPFPKQGDPPAYFDQLKALFRRHAGATLVWAHGGVGRVVHPVENHLAALAHFLEDPALSHLHVDLSWSEVAKYVVSSPDVVERTAAFVEKHQDRFLFGTDEVAPTKLPDYLAVYRTYEPLWQRLSPEASEKVRRTNCVRLLEAAKTRVRAWEEQHLARRGAARPLVGGAGRQATTADRP